MAKELTDQQYYENPENWGGSGCVTLQDVIDNIILTATDDSFFKNMKRFTASILGKQGLKKLQVDLKSEDKAISIQVPPSKMFPFPRYMTNWTRVSVLNDSGNIVPLSVNNSPQIKDYLQDHEYELIYDCEGQVLEGASFDAQEAGHCKVKVECCQHTKYYHSINDHIRNKMNASKNSMYIDSWVKPIKSGSYFEFSEDLVDKPVVIEFQSAGLENISDCDVKIPDALELVVTNWIKWKYVEGNSRVPESRIERFKREYKTEKNRAEGLLSDKISLGQIVKSVSLRYNQ